MKNNVRRITDGAMIVAIMGLLTVVDGQSGMLLDGLLFWFIPIPIVLYTVKYNLSDGIIIAVSTTLLSFIISLPHLAVLMGFSSIIGLAYGYGINKKKSMTVTLSLTFTATLTYYLLSMVVFAKFFGYDPVAETQQIIRFFENLISKASGQVSVVTFLRWTNPFFAMVILFVPFLPIVISFLQTITTHLVSVILLQRLNLAKIQIKPIIFMKLSKPFSILALTSLILTYLYFIIGLEGVDTVIIIVQFMAQLTFIIMGSILMLTYVSYINKPILGPLVALVVIVFPLIVMVLGIVDVFTKIRLNLLRRSFNERKS